MGGLSFRDVAEKISRFLNEYTAFQPFSGVAFAAVGGEVVFERAYGMACHEFSVPNTMRTRFSLASVSKQFTAFAVMLLYDKGLLDIDRPANLYLPERFQIPGQVLVRHLLNHTSGLYVIDYYKDEFYWRGNKTRYSRADFYDGYIKGRPLSQPSGEKYEYNNTGYNVLTWIVEHVSGLGFAEFLMRHIFKPLGMDSTFVDSSIAVIPHKALPYTYSGNEIVKAPFFNVAYSVGAGGMVSTAADLYIWFNCLKNRRLMSEKAYARYLPEDVDTGYCFGLSKTSGGGRVRYAHGGIHHGIATSVLHYLNDDVFVVALSNNDYSSSSGIAAKMMEIIFSGKAELPVKPMEIELGEALAGQYEGVYCDQRVYVGRVGGKWNLVLGGGEYSNEMYPIGGHKFAYRYKEGVMTLTECEDGVFAFEGLRKTR